MAKNKKSVLLYCDIIHTVENLSDVEAGILFKHYLRYVNDLNPKSDRLTELLFEPIKQNLKRDLKKWESKSIKNSIIAKEGWIKRKYANAYERIKVDANDADIVKVTDKDNVIVNVKDIVKVKENNIEERKLKFASTLSSYKLIYDSKELKKFYDYWTEPNKSNTKFRQELEKTWSLERRLDTWFNNYEKFKEKSSDKKEKPTTLKEKWGHIKLQGQ